jgi:hypothetical protein
VNDQLKKLLKELVPQCFGAQVAVSHEALADGDEGFVNAVRRQLSKALSDFILNSKILDGTDSSGFQMEKDMEFDATRCIARVHVLTPLELETLMQKAFDCGQRNFELPRPRFEFHSSMIEDRPGHGVPPPKQWVEQVKEAYYRKFAK